MTIGLSRSRSRRQIAPGILRLAKNTISGVKATKATKATMNSTAPTVSTTPTDMTGAWARPGKPELTPADCAVEDGPALLNALIEQRPDVAIVDIRQPPTLTDDGLRAAIAARRQLPGLPIVVLSQYVEQLYARELLADGAGAIGYLLKDRVANTDQFIATVRNVAGGATELDPQVITRILARNDARGGLSQPLGARSAPAVRYAFPSKPAKVLRPRTIDR
jgi:DNA-binding NarL/FixJ family response regulator